MGLFALYYDRGMIAIQSRLEVQGARDLTRTETIKLLALKWVFETLNFQT